MLIPDHIYIVTETFTCTCETGHQIPLLKDTKVTIERFIGPTDDDNNNSDDLKLVVKDVDHNIRYTINNSDFVKLDRDISNDQKLYKVDNNVIRYSKDGGKTIKQYRGNLYDAVEKLRSSGYIDSSFLGIKL